MQIARRQRYRMGSLRQLIRKSGEPVWEYRYRDLRDGGRSKQITFPVRLYPSERLVWLKLSTLLTELNGGIPPPNFVSQPTFGNLIDRFIVEEHLLEIRAQRAGPTTIEGLEYSTACAYVSILEGHIRPKWGDASLEAVRPMSVQQWLAGLPAAPKYKAKIKAIMHRLFERAMLWELIEIKRNPMELVELRGISKRRKRPFILSVEQYYAILAELPEPYRTMVIVAQCTGLRVSEILALKWADINFEQLTLSVTRKVVNGRVSKLKTEYSEDDLPTDPGFAAQLLVWKAQCPASSDGWVFPNPNTGRPYYASEIQKDYLVPAGNRVGLMQKGQKVNLGWHTFRHTYRSLLDASGAPIGVQQKLMRHAQVTTTMDVYGNALMESKREAHGKVVQMVLREQQPGNETEAASGRR